MKTTVDRLAQVCICTQQLNPALSPHKHISHRVVFVFSSSSLAIFFERKNWIVCAPFDEIPFCQRVVSYPIMSFISLFHRCKTLAETYFGSEKEIIRVEWVGAASLFRILSVVCFSHLVELQHVWVYGKAQCTYSRCTVSIAMSLPSIWDSHAFPNYRWAVLSGPLQDILDMTRYVACHPFVLWGNLTTLY